MGKRAFFDGVTGRLKAVGFVQTNDPGDSFQEVPEDFNLDPAVGWKWDGAKFVADPTPTTTKRETDLAALKDAIDAIAADAVLPGKVRNFVLALKKVL